MNLRRLPSAPLLVLSDDCSHHHHCLPRFLFLMASSSATVLSPLGMEGIAFSIRRGKIMAEDGGYSCTCRDSAFLQTAFCRSQDRCNDSAREERRRAIRVVSPALFFFWGVFGCFLPVLSFTLLYTRHRHWLRNDPVCL